MCNKKNIKLFYKHTQREYKLIKEKMNIIDIVIEVLDARAPYSSKNIDIDKIIKNKKKIIILNKSDIANAKETSKWINYYKKTNKYVIPFNAYNIRNRKNIFNIIDKIYNEKKDIFIKKGILNKKIVIMVVGVPNVGKSSLINLLVKRNIAKVENRASTTKGEKLININQKFQIFDTPGILCPNINDDNVLKKLYYISSIDDKRLNYKCLIDDLIYKLNDIDKNLIKNYYNIDYVDIKNIEEIFSKIAEKRKCITKNKKIDNDKVQSIILNDFRKSKFGPISIEKVEDIL